MLVIQWDALYEAIPRIQAKEHLAAWTVAVLATPGTEEGQHERDSILNSWRELATRSRTWLQKRFQSPTDFSGPNTPPGSSRDDSWFPPLAAFGRKMGEILGTGFRE